jgi:hypothetical protein
VGFFLRSDGRGVLTLPAAADLRERISQVHGLSLVRSLLTCSVDAKPARRRSEVGQGAINRPGQGPTFGLRAIPNRRGVEAPLLRLAPVVRLIGGLCLFP